MYRQKTAYIESFLQKIKKNSQEERGKPLAALFAYSEKHVDQLVSHNLRVSGDDGAILDIKLYFVTSHRNYKN